MLRLGLGWSEWSEWSNGLSLPGKHRFQQKTNTDVDGTFAPILFAKDFSHAKIATAKAQDL